MNEAYVRGFMEKCAELGVDPEALVKAAIGMPSMNQAATGIANAAVPGAGIGGLVGRGAQWLGKATSNMSMPSANGIAKAMIPGYGAMQGARTFITGNGPGGRNGPVTPVQQQQLNSITPREGLPIPSGWDKR